MTKENRILILDGAMGTMLQRRGLSGNSDMFNLTAPAEIESIHREYIAAGADIIETNTFGSNRISQAEQGHADDAAAMALAGARIARKAADSAGRKVLVAGSIGPSSKSLSIGTDADRPSWRPISFDTLAAAYKEQIDALIEGGVDFLLIETCFDALNVKAALYNVPEGFPVMISLSCADRNGRALTGQTSEAFYHAVKHCNLLAFGLNCSLGAEELLPLIAEVSEFVRRDNPSVKVSCYPNAGLPDESGGYSQSPEEMAAAMEKMARDGYVDIAGGCCGTTPEHIAAISRALGDIAPRLGREPFSEKDGSGLTVCGLECVSIDRKKSNFINIGERTNVAGSRKFARLIASGDYEAALNIASRQIEDGASVIDINMDDAMLDGPAAMEEFTRMAATEASVAKAAMMIDSSDWNTVLAGLKNCQGKCIVNSISLKEGEEEFLRKAREIRRFGAAMVVMAFDERGQATSFERKTEICRRSYSLLTAAGIAPSDIIFDVNVLTVGTGVEEDRQYGTAFIDAVRWIKANLPGALTSGGISNLSFAFRGNNPVREAMHSVFLYHAIQAGLDMAILNPGMLQIYDEIEPSLRKACEDVILDSDGGATDRLLEMASNISSSSGNGKEKVEEAKEVKGPDLVQLLIKGSSEGLAQRIEEALSSIGSAQAVIQGPLMEGMETVGNWFGEGKMFLPQVVKSARIMKEAVDLLRPYMEAESGEGSNDTRPVAVMATVKGDVHDIGKDITCTVLSCNGFRVVNLGVMVDRETIIEAAIRENASIIGVSGLITPSLAQMEDLCRGMAARGMDIPLFVGGATTSARHTALKLAPLYSHVFHGADASSTAVMAKKCVLDREAFEAREHALQEEIAAKEKLNAKGGSKDRESVTEKGDSALFAYLPEDGFAPLEALVSQEIPVREVALEELIPLLDWDMFLLIWRIRKSERNKPEVQEILRNAEETLKNMHCSIRLGLHFGCELGKPLGMFAASVHGEHPDSCPCEACRGNGMTEKVLRLCLAEAASEWIGRRLRVPEGYRLIRPGIGYPSCPDHRLKIEILSRIPDSQKLGISLTESLAMIPEASVCGFVVAHREARYL